MGVQLPSLPDGKGSQRDLILHPLQSCHVLLGGAFVERQRRLKLLDFGPPVLDRGLVGAAPERNVEFVDQVRSSWVALGIEISPDQLILSAATECL